MTPFLGETRQQETCNVSSVLKMGFHFFPFAFQVPRRGPVGPIDVLVTCAGFAPTGVPLDPQFFKKKSFEKNI